MITIYGNDDEVLSTKLTEILSCFLNYKSLNYLLKYIEGVSADSSFNQIEFEDSVKNSPNGIYFTYGELVRIEERSHQLIEMELIILDSSELKENLSPCLSQIAQISLVDGAYWEVDSINESAFENLVKLDGAKISTDHD